MLRGRLDYGLLAAEDGVSLPGSGLAVSQERRIIPLEQLVGQVLCLLVDVLLRLLVEDVVEVVHLVLE